MTSQLNLLTHSIRYKFSLLICFCLRIQPNTILTDHGRIYRIKHDGLTKPKQDEPTIFAIPNFHACGATSHSPPSFLLRRGNEPIVTTSHEIPSILHIYSPFSLFTMRWLDHASGLRHELVAA